MRDEQAERELLASAARDLSAAGVTVIDRPGRDASVARLHQLSHQGEPLTEQTHRAFPGHAAVRAQMGG